MSALWECLKDRNLWIGVLAGVVALGILEPVFLMVFRCRKGVDSVRIKDDGGEVTITRKAMRGFLRGLVAQVPGVLLKEFHLRQKKDGRLSLELFLALKDGAVPDRVQKALREILPVQLKERLGLQEQVSAVNLHFVQLCEGEGAQPCAPLPQEPRQAEEGKKGEE